MDIDENKFGENLLWFLDDYAMWNTEDVEGPEIEVYGEDENGTEGSCMVNTIELAAAAAKEIRSLMAERDELRAYKEAAEKQEPVCVVQHKSLEKLSEGEKVTAFGCAPHMLYNPDYYLNLFAKPVPAEPLLQVLDKIIRWHQSVSDLPQCIDDDVSHGYCVSYEKLEELENLIPKAAYDFQSAEKPKSGS